MQLVDADKKEGFRAGLPQHGAHDGKVKRTPILHGDLFKVEEGKKPVRKLIVEGNRLILSQKIFRICFGWLASFHLSVWQGIS